MTVRLKIIAFINDAPCLNARFDDAAAPSQRYGLASRLGAPSSAGTLYRRHCVFPYDGNLDAMGYARLLDELQGHEEAQLLSLNPGEFFGLQIGAWRDQNGIAFKETAPMPYWMQLTGYAAYKAERARRSGNRDQSAQLLKAAAMLRKRYEGSRELHNVRLLGLTVH